MPLDMTLHQARTVAWMASLGLALTIGTQLWTLTLSPTVWQDEAQIIDIGREWFEPESPASIWFEPGRSGLPQISYLGAVMLEAAYRWGGQTLVAPRLVCLLAAALAALACLVWLRRMGITPWLAWVAAFWLYLDPAVERSYRGARVDVLAIALAFGVCVLLSGGTPGQARWRLAVAGAVAAALPWIWLPAFLLWPLVGVAVWQHRPSSRSTLAGWPATAWLAGGALAATALVAWPMRRELLSTLGAMAGVLAFDATASNAGPSPTKGVWAGVWASIRYAPWLPVAAAAGAWLGGPPARLLGAAAGAVGVVVVVTRPYLYRYVYLVPYLVVLAAFAIQSLCESRRGWVNRIAHLAVIVTLLWSAGFALGYRTWVAVDERAGRDPERLRAALAQVVGGGRSVCLDSLAVYYAGRSLGWQMYRPSYPWRAADADTALRSCDVVILQSVFDSPARRTQMGAAGFDARTVVEIPTGRPPRRVGYGIGPYGPFTVYQRVR